MEATLRARVVHGRVVMDEPVDLPDGTELTLMPADADASLDDDDQHQLDAAIARGVAEAVAGQTVSAAEVMAAVRRRSRP